MQDILGVKINLLYFLKQIYHLLVAFNYIPLLKSLKILKISSCS